MVLRHEWTLTLAGLGLVLLAILLWGCVRHHKEQTMDNATTLGGESSSGQTEQAMFGAGCFWGVEAAFRRVEGVLDTAVGYSGGHTPEPTYEKVCAGTTGHAEVLLVTFDPGVISYGDLLDVFWEIHDPTTPNRQGPDIGSQYRSAVFYFSEAQRDAAEDRKQTLDASGRYSRPIVTEITEAGPFWRAEEYHQRYFEKTGRGTCHF